MSTASKPVPIVIPDDLGAQIDEAARLTKLSKAEIMRMSMRIGLEDLKRINYDIPGAVLDKSNRHKTVGGLGSPMFANTSFRLNEDPPATIPLIELHQWPAIFKTYDSQKLAQQSGAPEHIIRDLHKGRMNRNDLRRVAPHLKPEHSAALLDYLARSEAPK